MELDEALRSLLPVAEAIIGINQSKDQLHGIDQQISTATAQLSTLRKKAEDAKAAHQASLDGAAKAKDEVAVAQAATQKLLLDAKGSVGLIIADAKAQAQAEAETIRKSHIDSISLLASQTEIAKKALADLEDKIEACKRDHDQVLASMESLKKRLAGG